MRSSSSRSVAAVATLCCILSACGSGIGTSASTPSVATSTVAAPSPANSGTPSASPSGSYDPALVVEAEKVFREYQDGLSDAEGKGGAAGLPGPLLVITTSPIREQTAALLQQQSRERWHMEGAKPAVTVYGPVQVPSDRKGLIAIHGCVDATADWVVDQSGAKNRHGKAVEYISYFVRVGPDLKIADTDSRDSGKC